MCVSTTARSAHELGYDVVVAQDGVSDRDLPGYNGEEVTKVCELQITFVEVSDRSLLMRIGTVRWRFSRSRTSLERW